MIRLNKKYLNNLNIIRIKLKKKNNRLNIS